ncbi:FAD-dependent oxidoreductase [Moritella sp. Urea-trap-13]|uniref:FAD-dependent oxidoreductase n=1 Tax=Moritella sp. Urea-trap-13 TaxID=2058327 RepID=UPI000C33D055|nr:FAD-dependent oxidoreductase [Moritella sp. Urea-trap-13]PKH04598.1 FAD-dependent oxidoreductase [Moritella sp. Urea-trap-13]
MLKNIPSTLKSKRIAVIGGGIAGSTIALRLAGLDINVTLFEEGVSLVNGPPVCHLHAGGNLYPDISDDQCLTLLEQSIATMKIYPHCINKRPTVIAIPQRDAGNIKTLLPRLELLTQRYKSLIQTDQSNKVLGEADDYYQMFSRDDLELLKNASQPSEISQFSDWMIPLAKTLDLDSVKFPLLMVQEYGLSLFRIAASTELSLNASTSCNLLINTKVTNVTYTANNTWLITHSENGNQATTEVDYLINACGYRTGVIDDMADTPKERMVEFKAAYITHWQQSERWPEVVFHGERGTPEGMAQLTPYPDGYFQLHGMTEEITLFKNGLAKTTDDSAQPKLDKSFINKLIQGWDEQESDSRTQKAINHISHFIPSFDNAIIAGRPLFGAQQIPGKDVSLRAYDVSFEGLQYARAEIVKASSALTVADQIIHKLFDYSYAQLSDSNKPNTSFMTLSESDIDKRACSIAQDRNYPTSLAKI